MPRLAIDKDFLGDFSKLEKSVQSAVMSAFGKFEEHTYAGLHLEKLQKAKDDHIRTSPSTRRRRPARISWRASASSGKPRHGAPSRSGCGSSCRAWASCSRRTAATPIT